MNNEDKNVTKVTAILTAITILGIVADTLIWVGLNRIYQGKKLF